MNIQLFIGNVQPSEERLEPITEGIFMKPKGGLWTSTWDDEAYTSGWVEWLQESEYRDPYIHQWWLLTPDEKARVCTIATLQDLKKIVKQYPMANSMGYSLIDYIRLAQDYDAVHLTKEGQWTTRLTYPENLYGWDCESTLWLRWCFTGVQRIETSKEQTNQEEGNNP